MSIKFTYTFESFHAFLLLVISVGCTLILEYSGTMTFKDLKYLIFIIFLERVNCKVISIWNGFSKRTLRIRVTAIILIFISLCFAFKARLILLFFRISLLKLFTILDYNKPFWMYTICLNELFWNCFESFLAVWII